MNSLVPIKFKNQNVITTELLAEVYGTDTKNISNNFNNNKDKFEEGKHYYFLEGEELKEFKGSHMKYDNLKFAPKLYLWTERGANRHCKILDTDKAWEQFDNLEETYFRVKENKPLNTQTLSPLLQVLVNIELKQSQIEQDITTIKKELVEIRQPKIKGLKRTMPKWAQDVDAIIALNALNWRSESMRLIRAIAGRLGNFGLVSVMQSEIYPELERRCNCDLEMELMYRRKKLTEEGVPRYKINRLNYLDLIADNRLWVQKYVDVVKDVTIKYGGITTYSSCK